jgi:hypothetical protein
MMDQVLAFRRNPNPTWDDVCDLLGETKTMIVEAFGLNPRYWPRSAFGPLGGVLDGVYKHPVFQKEAAFREKLRNRFAVWLFLHVAGVKRRPGYNDFLLVRWALLGDEPTAVELTQRATREDSIGCTLCWALRSLCEQYPEFRVRFIGAFPKAKPAHMLRDAPAGSDMKAVLRRAEWIDKARVGPR